METVNFKKEQRKRKWREFKDNVKGETKHRWYLTKEWFSRNKEAVIVLTPFIIKGVTSICKVVGKHYDVKKQEHLQKEFCYDRSLGHYWELRRPLTNREWLEIDRRKKNGERLADILTDMRVLK